MMFVLALVGCASPRTHPFEEYFVFMRAFGPGRPVLKHPSAAAFSPDGRLFVSDTGNHRVLVFSRAPDGAMEQESVLEGDLDRPMGLAFDAKGRLLVADAGNERLAIFTRELKFETDLELGFEVIGVAVDEQGNLLLSGRDRLLAYGSDGKLIARAEAGGPMRYDRATRKVFVGASGFEWDGKALRAVADRPTLPRGGVPIVDTANNRVYFPGETARPEILDVDETSVIVGWTTNRPCMTRMALREGGPPGEEGWSTETCQFRLVGGERKQHVLIASGLKPGTRYWLRVYDPDAQTIPAWGFTQEIAFATRGRHTVLRLPMAVSGNREAAERGARFVFVHSNMTVWLDLTFDGATPVATEADLVRAAFERLGAEIAGFRRRGTPLELLRNWPRSHYFFCAAGEVLLMADEDGDGVPDNDPRLPFDEARFGSDPRRTDTDLDGLDDLSEALYGSDPRTADTDRDGLDDGRDPYPRYAFKNAIRSTPSAKLDGVVEPGEYQESYAFEVRGRRCELHLGWTREYLMIAWIAAAESVSIRVDQNADGWFAGNDNVRLEVDSDGRAKCSVLLAAIAGHEPFEDQKYMGVRDGVRTAAGKIGAVRHFEIWIAKNRAGLACEYGERLGVSFVVGGVAAFDPEEFLEIELR